MYDVIVADARSPRDGRFIEKLGIFNPNTNPASVDIDTERALHWVMNGALPTDTARNILSSEGVMLRKHLQVGVMKGAITQEEADKRFENWKSEKEKLNQGKVDQLNKSKEDAKKERLAAESKVKEARAEAIQASLAAAVEETKEAIAEAETNAEMGESLAEDVAEVEEAQAEAPAEAKAEEAPAEEEAEAEAVEEETAPSGDVIVATAGEEVNMVLLPKSTPQAVRRPTTIFRSYA